MTTVRYKPQPVNVNLNPTSLAQIPASLSDSLGSTFKETILTNPTKSLIRILTNKSAEGEDKISAEDANAQFSVKGLSFDEPISPRLAKIKRDTAVKQAQRRNIEARGPSGIGTTIAKLGVGLAGSIVDPINVGSAFIPGAALRFVGIGSNLTKSSALGQSARNLLKASTRGTVGQRAGIGAIEGAIGAAIVEPLPLLAAKGDNLDYGLADSFLNIAFGTVFGGGLHALGAGLELKARTRKEAFIQEQENVILALQKETQDALTVKAVDDAVKGRISSGNEHIVAGDVNVQKFFEASKTGARAVEVLDSAIEFLNARNTNAKKGAKLSPEKIEADALDIVEGNGQQAFQESLRKEGFPVDEMLNLQDDIASIKAETIRLREKLKIKKTGKEKKLFDDEQAGVLENAREKLSEFIKTNDNGKIKTAQATALRQKQVRANTPEKGVSLQERTRVNEEFVNQEVNKNPELKENLNERKLASQQEDPQFQSYGSRETADEFDTRFSALDNESVIRAEEEVRLASEQLDANIEALDLDKVEIDRQLKLFDDSIEQAKALEDVYKSTAFCVSRRG